MAIEVDGPHHFTCNTLMPLGEMRARSRLLESRGWEVISIPFFKWSHQKAQVQKDFLLKVCPNAQIISIAPIPLYAANRPLKFQPTKADLLTSIWYLLPGWVSDGRVLPEMQAFWCETLLIRYPRYLLIRYVGIFFDFYFSVEAVSTYC